MHSHKTQRAADKSPDKQLLEVARHEGWILKWSIFEWCSKHTVGDQLVLHTQHVLNILPNHKVFFAKLTSKNAHSSVEWTRYECQPCSSPQSTSASVHQKIF